MESTIKFKTGKPGAGKTYISAGRHTIEYLVETARKKDISSGKETIVGKHISNLPLNCELIAKEVTRIINKKAKLENYFETTYEEQMERILLIPRDYLKEWVLGTSGPWELFKEMSENNELFNCHIAIDECHVFFNNVNRDIISKWDNWLAEIRHKGATIEFITQYPRRVPEVVRSRAGIRVYIENMELVSRDPLFRIRLFDWYQLQGKFFRYYSPAIFVSEYIATDNGFSRTPDFKKKYRIDKYYFKFYDTHSASLDEKRKEEKQLKKLYPYQEKTHFQLVLWFLNRNWFQFSTRGFVLWFILYFCFNFGDFLFAGSGFISDQVSMGFMPKKPSKKVDKPKPKVKKLSKNLSKIDTSVNSDTSLSKKVEKPKPKKSLDYRVSFISEDYAILDKNFIIVRKGDVVFDKITVKEIDFDNRKILLSNGDFLFM